MAGYTNLYEGIASADSASPIPDIRRVRVLGAARDTSPAAVLSLANVRHLISPYRAAFPEARPVLRTGGIYRFDLPPASGRIFFPRRVASASDEEVYAAFGKPGFEPGDVAYLPPGTPLPPLGRGAAGAHVTVARVTVDRPEETRISWSSSVDSFLVLTRSWDDGWKATADGHPLPLLRVDAAFSGLALPSGDHEIVLRYRPLSFRIGAALSVAGLIALAFLWLNEPPEGRAVP